METARVCERPPERHDGAEATTADADAVTEPQPETGLRALRGRIHVAEDLDELPDDIAAAFGQE
jgi:hypothetical protein